MSNQPKHLVRFEVPHRGGDCRGGILADFFFFVGLFFSFLKSKTKGGGGRENKNTPMVGRRAVKGGVYV